jgi:hypothetical protein
LSQLVHVLKRSAPALIAHWVMTLYGVGCFILTILLIGKTAISGTPVLYFLMSFAVGVVFWQGVGNLLGLLRVRLGLLALAWGGIIALSAYMAPAIPMFGLFFIIGAFAFPAGALALRGRAELFGSWPPLAYAIWGAVLWMNFHGKVKVWKTGAKFAVWDGYTVAILSGAVLLFLVFLVFRQALALTWWQEEGEPLKLRGARGVAKKPARPGFAGMGCVVLMAVALAAATALLAPFLFRTAPADGDGGKDKPEQVEEEPDERDVDPMNPDLPNPNVDAMVKVIEKVVKVGGAVAKELLPKLILLLLFYIVAARPLRRLLLVRHLEKPLWKLSPTRRIQNLWIRSLIALDDLGVKPRGDETPEDVAERANAEFIKRFGEEMPGLEESASIYQSVEFAGRGIQPHEAQGMAIMVGKLSRWASERLSLGEKLKAGYRGRMRQPR